MSAASAVDNVTDSAMILTESVNCPDRESRGLAIAEAQARAALALAQLAAEAVDLLSGVRDALERIDDALRNTVGAAS